MSLMYKLTNFIADINYSMLPQESINIAKKCLLDGLGVTLAGACHPAARKLQNFCKNLNCSSRTSILGSDIKTSPPLAALVNGTMCHVLDFDDTNWIIRGHPTTVLLPTILAVAEDLGVGGKDILLAYILGFEVACKIARAINPGHYDRGYHSTSTIGIFGAVTAAGKLLKLTPKELAYAFGIAGSKSSGLRANFGTETKSLHAGMAAHDAITAVLLAKNGYESNSSILDSEWGFGHVMCPKANFASSFEKLGEPFDIVFSSVTVKRYPSCARTHTALDALFELLEKTGIRLSDIAGIKCGTDEECFNILIHPLPNNGLEAKFSMPYCIAKGCIDGELTLAAFEDKNIKDPSVRDLMQHIDHYADPSIIEKGYDLRASAKIIIKLKDGRTFENTVCSAKGGPENPLSFEELADKFSICAKSIIDLENIDKIIHLISRFEHITNLNTIIKLLTK